MHKSARTVPERPEYIEFDMITAARASAVYGALRNTTILAKTEELIRQ